VNKHHQCVYWSRRIYIYNSVFILLFCFHRAILFPSCYSVFIVLFCFHRANWQSRATLTEGFPCLFLICKANDRVYLAKTDHGPQSSYFQLCCSMYSVVLFYVFNCVVLCIVLIVMFYVLFLSIFFLCILSCKCVPYYCHRVSTQLQLNISYHIMNDTYTGSRSVILAKHGI
jgi:hypothetical protein